MKKSIFSWFGYFMPIEKRLELIKRAGFESVSLWWEDEISPELVKKEDMPQIVFENGLLLEYIHAPYKDVDSLWSLNKKERSTVLERYFGYIEDCGNHKIQTLVMHCSDRNLETIDIETGFKSFRILSEFAQERDVKIAIENTKDAHLLDTLFTELELPNLGLCYDSSHDWLEGQTKGKIFEKWAKRTFVTHLSDNDGLKDMHWLPGDGKVDWDVLRSHIGKSDLKCLSMEVTGSVMKFENPEEFIFTAYERLLEITGES